jgi:hypothetical protein
MHVWEEISNLAKAFDYVNHEILLAKLNCCSIEGPVANWFRT